MIFFFIFIFIFEVDGLFVFIELVMVAGVVWLYEVFFVGFIWDVGVFLVDNFNLIGFLTFLFDIGELIWERVCVDIIGLENWVGLFSNILMIFLFCEFLVMFVIGFFFIVLVLGVFFFGGDLVGDILFFCWVILVRCVSRVELGVDWGNRILGFIVFIGLFFILLIWFFIIVLLGLINGLEISIGFVLMDSSFWLLIIFISWGFFFKCARSEDWILVDVDVFKVFMRFNCMLVVCRIWGCIFLVVVDVVSVLNFGLFIFGVFLVDLIFFVFLNFFIFIILVDFFLI